MTRTEQRMRVLSGMRPTGRLHLGHLEGVLANWKQLQDVADCYFFVADWHALTTAPDAREAGKYTRSIVKDWLAYGIDPKQSTIFVQSMVPEHAELNIALSNFVSQNRLEQLPTYKEYVAQIKAKTGERPSVGYGFLGYPVLQSADILLYDTTHVPVGEDQVPHIELTREIARRFNRTFGKTFVVPQALLGEHPRILGYDGRKMSKSYGNVIDPLDNQERIASGIKKMPTDPTRVRANVPGDPSVCSVYDIHHIVNAEAQRVANECREGARSCLSCKNELAATLDERFVLFRERRANISDSFVDDVLSVGATDARIRAHETMQRTREALGLYRNAIGA